MAKEKYMALADLQSLWTNKQKPYIAQTYATKMDTETATTDTCMSIIEELV